MLGVVIVNGANQIVQSFGNIAFKIHLLSTSGQAPNELSSPSTSIATSGISSASTTSLNRNSVNKNLVQDLKIDDSILLQNILPMIVLYRTQKSNNGENLSQISSKVKFIFQDLDGSNLLIVIGQESYADLTLKKFAFEVVHLLKFHYGIFINFIKADLSSIRKSKVKFEKKMSVMVQNFKDLPYKQDSFNVNSMFSNIANYAELQPIFTQLTSDVHKAIGNVRCLFMSSGQLIGSTCSHTRDNTPIFELVDSSDLKSVLALGQRSTDSNNNNSVNGKIALKCQTEHVWLNYPAYNRRQLVNVFLFSISNDIDIVCLCSIEQSTLIHTLCDLLVTLEGLESEEMIKEKVEKIEELVQRSSKLILELKMNSHQKSADFQNCVFLTSPLRTEKLLRSLWRRLLNELERFSNPQKEPSSSLFPSAGVSRRESLRNTIHRWGSSFSVGSSHSGSTSLFPKLKPTSPTSPSSLTGSMRIRGGFPVQICALISNFSRQVRSVLNELCVYSQNSAKVEKFEKFMEVVRRFMDKTRVWKVQNVMANVMNNAVLGEPLKPVVLGLDMLAYRFERLDSPLNFSYIPDSYKEVFAYMDASKTSDYISVSQLKTGEKFIQITGVNTKKPENSTLRKIVPSIRTPPKKLSKDIQAADLPIRIFVLFSDSINLKLAVKQTNKLARILNIRMKNVSKLFK